MTVYPQLLTGLNVGLKTSTLTKYGAAYSLDDLTPSIIAEITGQAAPDLMWLGKDASGADELVVGTDDLVDLSSPDKQTTSTILGGTVTEFTTTSQSMDAQANTVADVGSETVTVMWIGVPTAFTALRDLLSKRDPANPRYGYELHTTTDGYITWGVQTTSGGNTRTISVDHGTTNPQVILASREWTNNISALWTREGTATGTRNQETLTNVTLFSLGAGRYTGNLAEFGACMIWIGTDGDFGDAAAFSAARVAIAEALGYE